MQNATWSPGCTPASRSRRRQPVGGGVELGERRDGAGGRHDDRRLVGLGLDEGTGVHGARTYSDGTVERWMPGARAVRRVARRRRSPACSSPAIARRDVPLGAAALALSAVLRALDRRPPTSARSTTSPPAARRRRSRACAGTCSTTLGFAGDHRRRTTHPRNSFLDVVLERRRGLPIRWRRCSSRSAARVGVAASSASACRCTSSCAPPTTTTRSSTRSPARPSTAPACRRRFEALAGGAHAVGRPPPRRRRRPRLIVVRMLTNLRASLRAPRRPPSASPSSPLMRAAIPELGADGRRRSRAPRRGAQLTAVH